MNCKYLTIRSDKGMKRPYCRHTCSFIDFSSCSGCLYKEYKKVPRIALNKSIRKVSKKRVFVSSNTYQIVYDRDNGRCRMCGSYLIELHHILYRSQRKDLIDEPNNCIMLCNTHHRLVHSNKKKYQPMLLEMVKD